MTNSADRMAHIAPFHVMKLLARAKELEAQGKSIVHMEIGEPDFSTPKPIIDAGIKALEQGLTQYTPALGLPALRQAIANYYQTHYGVCIKPESVVVTPGASGALQLVCGVLVNPGDEVLMTDPGYPCNRHFVQLMGGVPTFVQLDEDNGHAFTLEALKTHCSDKTKAVLLASPSNPTGMVLDVAELDEIAEYLKQKEAYLILDEIYHGLIYDADFPTFAGRHENVFIINSFSKYFCMTGWRLGWLLSPKAFVADIDKLAQNIFLAASTPAQHAALAAFKPESIEIMESYRAEFKIRRDFLFDAVGELGFKVISKPQGAFYLYADSSGFSKEFSSDSFGLVHDLLENAGVAITPGVDFGNYKANQHVRFAYTTSLADLKEGIARLSQYRQRKSA